MAELKPASQPPPRPGAAHKGRPARRPQLRCPGCGFMIDLPAEVCDECRFDLRLGCRPKRRLFPKLPQTSRQFKNALRLAAVACLACFIWQAIQNYQPAPPPAPAEIPGAPDSFDQLAAKYPELLQPYTYPTQSAVIGYNKNLASRQKYMEDLARSLSYEYGDKAGSTELSRRMTPAQRMRVMNELMAITAGSGSRNTGSASASR